MSKKVTGLPYYGGKVGRGIGNWINSLLPEPRRGLTYVEPYGGMAGVLFQREPKGIEIYNDLNARIVNWFRCMRDSYEEMAHLITYTPYSEDEYKWAIDNVDNYELSDTKRALALHIILWLSIYHGDGRVAPFSRKMGNVGSNGKWDAKRVEQIAKRLGRVIITNEDAIVLLNRVKNNKNVVVYVDPPYKTANTSPYYHADIDYDALKETLVAQKGLVAISGYGEEWDDIGWESYNFNTTVSPMAKGNTNSYERVEKLWLNNNRHVYQKESTLFDFMDV